MLASAEWVVGYARYLELVSPLTRGKETFSTGMTGEVERCRKAIELASSGRSVAVVSSGDAGIYGMAGLLLELMGDGEVPFGVEVVPGVPAFAAAAAVLGAPLMHDFASVSLSDLLTPWETIERRVEAAASGDFVIVLYNPKSKKRTAQLPGAVDIIRRYREPSTPVGVVRNASRDDEEVRVTTLGGVESFYDTVDMSTLLVIGNSTTYTAAGRMVTPRGYGVGK